jgi:hypothetical protein
VSTYTEHAAKHAARASFEQAGGAQLYGPVLASLDFPCALGRTTTSWTRAPLTMPWDCPCCAHRAHLGSAGLANPDGQDNCDNCGLAMEYAPASEVQEPAAGTRRQQLSQTAALRQQLQEHGINAAACTERFELQALLEAQAEEPADDAEGDAASSQTETDDERDAAPHGPRRSRTTNAPDYAHLAQQKAMAYAFAQGENYLPSDDLRGFVAMEKFDGVRARCVM